MKLLYFRYYSKTLNNSLLSCYYSTSPKYVNEARSGNLNFAKDFQECHIETTTFQKVLLGLGSSFMSITDPRRGDMVAVMGESTGALAFEYVRSKMLQSEEGRKILLEKPRISSASVDLECLKKLPEGTLGKAYSNFLERYKYSPDERLNVRFVDDLELAYVAQRYREAHDLFHTILEMPTNMLGEVTVKWVEAIQTRLPMCVTGALFGPLRLAPKFTRTYSTKVLKLDDVVQAAIRSKELKPHNHSGKMKNSRKFLPDVLEKRIINILKESNALKEHSNKLRALKITLYRRLAPVEGLKKHQMMTNYRNKLMEKLAPKILSTEKLNTVLDKHCVNYEKSLKKLSEPPRFNKNECLMYLLARAPYEYATVLTVFMELMKHDPAFRPQTLLDFGSGVGTVTWAASTLWRKSLKEYFTVDASVEMNELAHRIIQPSVKEKQYVSGFIQRQSLPSDFETQFDIVIGSFSFSHLRNFEERMEKLCNLWNKSSKYLILIENGTLDGFQLINEVREMILQQSLTMNFKCHIVAPCPHDLVCPRTTMVHKKPCHFLSLYREFKVKKEEEFAETPFSYLIIKKERRGDDKQWPRILSETRKIKRNVFCEMCTAQGTIDNVTISKARSEKELYKCAKQLKWGDNFPGTIIKQEPHLETSEENAQKKESSSVSYALYMPSQENMETVNDQVEASKTHS